MNWIWIILLLCCCNGNNNRNVGCGCDNNCIQPRRDYDCDKPRYGESRYGKSRCEMDRDYPRAPFAPDDRDCGCRASEMEQDDCDE